MVAYEEVVNDDEDEFDPTDPPTLEPPTDKPGWQTSEFWFQLAAVVVAVILNLGIFPEDSPYLKILTIVAATLASLGYAAVRTVIKRSHDITLREYNRGQVQAMQLESRKDMIRQSNVNKMNEVENEIKELKKMITDKLVDIARTVPNEDRSSG